MPENETLVSPISANIPRVVAELQLRTGRSRDELMSALVEWFAEQEADVQRTILGADRTGGSDLAQLLTEWNGVD